MSPVAINEGVVLPHKGRWLVPLIFSYLIFVLHCDTITIDRPVRCDTQLIFSIERDLTAMV